MGGAPVFGSATPRAIQRIGSFATDGLAAVGASLDQFGRMPVTAFDRAEPGVGAMDAVERLATLRAEPDYDQGALASPVFGATQTRAVLLLRARDSELFPAIPALAGGCLIHGLRGNRGPALEGMSLVGSRHDSGCLSQAGLQFRRQVRPPVRSRSQSAASRSHQRKWVGRKKRKRTKNLSSCLCQHGRQVLFVFFRFLRLKISCCLQPPGHKARLEPRGGQANAFH
jgi:hypothetical protein